MPSAAEKYADLLQCIDSARHFVHLEYFIFRRDSVGNAFLHLLHKKVNEGVEVFLDESLRRFETVFPAVGSGNSAIELNLDELYEYSKALEWIDVCKLPEE